MKTYKETVKGKVLKSMMKTSSNETVKGIRCDENTLTSKLTTLEETKPPLEAELVEMKAQVKSLETKLRTTEAELVGMKALVKSHTFHNALRKRTHWNGLLEDIPDLPTWIHEAVYRKCDAEKKQQNNPKKKGKQEGRRGLVIDGRGMNAFGEVAYQVAKHAGVPDKDIQTTSTCIRHQHQTIVPKLPGSYRPTKQWDFAVVRDGQLVCVVELKSIDDLGRNLSNRLEESLGQGDDFIEMLEHNNIHPDTIWNGYLIIAPFNKKTTHEGTHTYKTTVENLSIDSECLNCTYQERTVHWLRNMQTKRNWTKTGCGLYLKNEERVARDRIRPKGDELKRGDVVEAWNPDQSQWFGGTIYGIHDGSISRMLVNTEDGSVTITPGSTQATVTSTETTDDGTATAYSDGSIVTVGSDGTSSVTVVDASGESTRTVVNADGSITVTSADGQRVTTTSKDGKSVTVVSADGKTTKMVLMSDGMHITTNDDGSTSVSRPDGTTLSVSADGNTVTRVDPDGDCRKTVVTTNADGSVKRVVTSVDGSKLIIVTDADGVTTTINHEAPYESDRYEATENKDGRTTVTPPDGTTIRVSADKRTVTREDPDGTTTVTTTDADGSKTVVTRPDGSSEDGNTVTYTDGTTGKTTVVTVNDDGTTTTAEEDGRRRTISADGTESVIVNADDGTVDLSFDLHDLVFHDHRATDVSLLSFFLSMFAFLKKQYGGI